MPRAYRNPVLRRGQEESFRGFSPTIGELREASAKGFTVLRTDIGPMPEEGFSKFLWKFQHGFSTKPIEEYTAGFSKKGLIYRVGGAGSPIKTKGLDIVNPLNLTRDVIKPYRKSVGTSFFSSDYAAQVLRTGKFNPSKGYYRQFSRPIEFPISWAGGKKELPLWLEWGAGNKRFSAATRKSFEWSRAHTIESINLGETYRLFGRKGGREVLEARFGAKFEDLVFRHTLSARSEGTWLGIRSLSAEQQLAFTGEGNLLAGKTKFPFWPKPSEWEGEYVLNKFAKRSSTQATRKLKLSLFHEQIQVSKLENLAGEYRTVFAGGEMVSATHRWGPPGVREFFKKRPALGKIFEPFGIKSGTPELMFPVFGKQREILAEYTRKQAKHFSMGVGALDIGRLAEKRGMSALRIIEVQKSFGDISRPGVLHAIEARLAGKWPTGRKIAVAAAGLAAIGLAGKALRRSPEGDGEVAQKNMTQALRNKNTAGLTNLIMHNKRTQHQVMDVREKTKHLFRLGG